MSGKWEKHRWVLLNPDFQTIKPFFEYDIHLDSQPSPHGRYLALYRQWYDDKPPQNPHPILIIDMNGTLIVQLPDEYSELAWLNDRYLLPRNMTKPFLDEPVVYDVEERKMVKLRKEGF